MLRGGLTHVSPESDSSDILVGGADYELGGTKVGSVTVDDNMQFGITVFYFTYIVYGACQSIY